MKKLMTIAVAVAMCATAAQAQMVAYEDFEAYTAGATIHMQGTDVAGVPRWYAQHNSSSLADSGAAIVYGANGNQFLRLGSSKPDGSNDFDTLGAAMAMKSQEITGLGTIYLRWLVNDVCSPMTLTNDLNPGWDYASAGTASYAGGVTTPGVIGTDYWQEGYGGEGYSAMGAMVNTGGGINFNARNGGGYVDAVGPQALQVGVWQELWMQIDAVNHNAMYFTCLQGGVPVQMINPGPDGIPGNADDSPLWGNRDQAQVNDSVANLKWIVSNWGYTDAIPNVLHLDTIGIDTQAHTLDMVGPEMLPDVPEPATMSLLALGGLALIRRRR